MASQSLNYLRKIWKELGTEVIRFWEEIPSTVLLTEDCPSDVDIIQKIWNHYMVWVGRDLTYHQVPVSCHGQGHLEQFRLLKVLPDLSLDTAANTSLLIKSKLFSEDLSKWQDQCKKFDKLRSHFSDALLWLGTHPWHAFWNSRRIFEIAKHE